MTEESLVWFAYEGTDRIYVASATAGKLANATADITFSDSYEKPLEMSAEFGNGTQYYGTGKTFTLTFTTNKAGTYTLASDVLTFTSSDVSINNSNQFTVNAAGTYKFTCTTTTWSTKASVTITPVSPLTGKPVSDEGEERTWLQIGKLSCSSNSPDSNTTVYLRNSDDQNKGNWTWSQITNGNAEVKIENLGQDDSGYYFRYSTRGMWTINYNSEQLNAAQINADTEIHFKYSNN